MHTAKINFDRCGNWRFRQYS